MALTTRTITETLRDANGTILASTDIIVRLKQPVSSGGVTLPAHEKTFTTNGSGLLTMTLECFDDGTTTVQYEIELSQDTAPLSVQKNNIVVINLISGSATTLSALRASSQAVFDQNETQEAIDSSIATALADYVPKIRTIAHKTANYTILISENGYHFTNKGSSGVVSFYLPTYADGAREGYCYTISSSEFGVELRSDNGVNAEIRYKGEILQQIGCVDIGHSITVECIYAASDEMRWQVTNIVGNWA